MKHFNKNKQYDGICTQIIRKQFYVKTKSGDRKNRLLKKLPEDRHAMAKTTLPLKVTQEFLYNFPTFKAKKKKKCPVIFSFLEG